MRTPLRLWLGTSFLGLSLLAGCNHHRQQCDCACNANGYGGYGPGLGASDRLCAAAPRPQPVQAATSFPMSLPVYSPPPKPDVLQAGHADAKPDQTVVPAAVPAQSGPWANADAAKDKDKGVQQAGYIAPLTGGKEDPVRRRSYTDITAHPCFGHASDYSWISGELSYLHVRNVWRVRYASCDEDDPYGGSLTLTETGPMDAFKDGQMVRVEGTIVTSDTANKAAGAIYRVRSIQPIGQ